jgi:hypothetical protein
MGDARQGDHTHNSGYAHDDHGHGGGGAHGYTRQRLSVADVFNVFRVFKAVGLTGAHRPQIRPKPLWEEGEWRHVLFRRALGIAHVTLRHFKSPLQPYCFRRLSHRRKLAHYRHTKQNGQPNLHTFLSSTHWEVHNRDTTAEE